MVENWIDVELLPKRLNPYLFKMSQLLKFKLVIACGINSKRRARFI
jgi:hypothetical protein